MSWGDCVGVVGADRREFYSCVSESAPVPRQWCPVCAVPWCEGQRCVCVCVCVCVRACVRELECCG